MGLDITIADYEKQKAYIADLERTRATLMRVNQDLRDKIEALERGQYDIQIRLEMHREYTQDQANLVHDMSLSFAEALGHSNCFCEKCNANYIRYAGVNAARRSRTDP